MVRMPTSMAKNKIPKEQDARDAAFEAVDEMVNEAQEVRKRHDLGDRGRRTLEQLQEETRNLGDYAKGKMEHMNDVMRDAAATARDKMPNAVPGPTDAIRDNVMDSLKTASEKLSAEITDLNERVESVKARVQQSMQTAGINAKDTWYQTSEAAKNIGEREYCLPLPTDRICSRHVAFVGIPLLVLFLLLMVRSHYPKKWNAGVNKMKKPRMMLARETPSTDQLKAKMGSVAENVEDKIQYGKQRGSELMDQARGKYQQPVENKTDQ